MPFSTTVGDVTNNSICSFTPQRRSSHLTPKRGHILVPECGWQRLVFSAAWGKPRGEKSCTSAYIWIGIWAPEVSDDESNILKTGTQTWSVSPIGVAREQCLRKERKENIDAIIRENRRAKVVKKVTMFGMGQWGPRDAKGSGSNGFRACWRRRQNNALLA
jgi:hypothetical protein